MSLSQYPIHSIGLDQLLEVVKSNTAKGIDPKEVGWRKRTWGENTLREYTPPSFFKVFLAQLKNPLYLLLALASLAIFVLEKSSQKWWDFGFIVSVIFINSFIGTLQEYKAQKDLYSLLDIGKNRVWVKRNGKITQIEEREVVVGDIVFLRPGNVVPADGRIIKASNLFVSEAHLSGEWEPVAKRAGTLSLETPLLERSNMLFKGSVVEAGEAELLVTAVGENTEMGKIAKAILTFSSGDSAFYKKISRFTKGLSFLLIGWALVVILIALLQKRGRLEILELAIAVVVGAIPEALPLITTFSLLVKARTLAKEGVLTKRLASLETLGEADVICLDKTGTLTFGKMAPVKLQTLQEIKSLPFSPYTNTEKLIAKTLFWANSAKELQEGTQRLIGSPTDQAILRAGLMLKGKELSQNAELIEKRAFSFARKWQGALIQEEEKKIWYITGAPEKLLALSLNPPSEKNFFKDKLEDFTLQGFRCVGLAISNNREDPEKGILFLGILLLNDPPRKRAGIALKKLSELGVRTVIITGDHKNTTLTLLSGLGVKVQEEETMSGQELEKLTPPQLRERIENIRVFYRVEPQQKLKIVEAFRAKGRIVAMSGDGINDLLALKRSDVSISLKDATTLAKEVSDLVLTDNNLFNLVEGVLEGRGARENIKKSTAFVLADSFSATILITLTLFLGLPLPLLWSQILFNNVIEDTFPPLAFAFSPRNPHELDKKREKEHASVLDRHLWSFSIGGSILAQTFLFIVYLNSLFWLKLDIEVVRTMVFATIALNTLFIMLPFSNLYQPLSKTRFWKNPYLIASGALIVIALLWAIYWDFWQRILKTRPLSIYHWSLVISLCLLWSSSIEVLKQKLFIERKDQSHS